MSEHPYSKVKSIFLPLFKYKFDHGPSDVNKKNVYFKGREAIKERIQLLFDHSKSKHGAYLITGYRGMGKTSVVREALSQEVSGGKAFKDTKNLKVFNFSLSQDEVRDIDLMRQIGVSLSKYCKAKILNRNFIHRGLDILLFFVSFLLALRVILTIYSKNEYSVFFNPTHFVNDLVRVMENELQIGFAFLFFGLFAFLLLSFRQISSIISSLFYDPFSLKKQLAEDLNIFSKRLSSSVTREDLSPGKIHLGDTNPFTTVSNTILDSFRSGIDKNSKDTLSYSPASSKEIEHYLNEILISLEKIRSHNFYRRVPSFIFIIDELDKVEPDYFFAPGDRESDQYLHHNESPFHITTKARKRQEAIAKLLANLKNFLNDAKAKFIFIGGRDIYDASLADIADRESFYSSIFNEVIYVNTFFKDREPGSENAGLSQLTENFLFQFLLPDKDSDNEPIEIGKMEKYLNKILIEKDDQLFYEKQFKIVHTLQNFFIFLLYRSNGSPKKLIELIERFIVREPKEDNWNNWVVKFKNRKNEGAKLFLKFSYTDQYEINLTSNLYRPYTIINSRHLKSLGDKLLYSSAFLMDHILKFHRTAFSWRNLEMIPDIILANKDPNFRPFFRDLMQFLSNQHVRQTLNAVFQYKFYNKVKNEIEYLSKISEFSSAAFNFTLDESFHLKSYYKKKLAAKYLEYRDYDSRANNKDYIHSIGYLHSLIADLHYYDEEFDDAIIHYTDSIQSLREMQAKKETMLDHQFVLYTRNLLNLGLSLEKMQSYDKAYSVYRSLILFSKSFNDENEEAIIKNTFGKDWETPYKRVQLFLRPHIALLGVIEKQRTDGITYDNLTRNIKEYSQFLGMDKLELFPSGRNKTVDYSEIPDKEKEEENRGEIIIKKYDKKRIVTLLADYYVNVGGLLFFKNHVFFRMLYEGEKIPQEQVTSEISEYYKANKENSKAHRYRPSHAGYLYYLHALSSIISPYYENRENFKSQFSEKIKNDDFKDTNNLNLIEKLDFLFFFLEGKGYPILNSNQNETIANILSKLGDALLACIPPENELDSSKELLGTEALKLLSGDFDQEIENLKAKILAFKPTDSKEKKSNPKNLDIELVFLIFGLSYKFFSRAGKIYSASFQYKKILYIIRDSSKSVVKTYEENELIGCIVKIAEKILKNLAEVSNASNRAQISKYRFYTNEKEEFTPHIYKGLSTETEIKEVLSMVETVRLKYKNGHKKAKSSLNPYSTVSSMFSRLFELKLHAEKLFDELEDELKISNKEELIELYKNFEGIKKSLTDLKLNHPDLRKVTKYISEIRKKTKQRPENYFNNTLENILENIDNKKLGANAAEEIQIIQELFIENKIEFASLESILKEDIHDKETKDKITKTIKKCGQNLNINFDEILETSKNFANRKDSFHEIRKLSIWVNGDLIILTESILEKLKTDNVNNSVKIDYLILINTFSKKLITFLKEAKGEFQSVNLLLLLSKIQYSINNFDPTFKNVYFPKNSSNPTKKEKHLRVISKILDGLFCCINAIKILNTYGTGYILTNSFLASFHRLVGLYGILYEIYEFYEYQEANSDKLTLHSEKTKLFGESAFIDFDPYYHFDLARQGLTKAIQLHSEGKSYKIINRGMFTLDDDFNDSLTHFCAAVERYTMNSGQKYRTLKRMEKNLSESRMNKYENYVG